MYSGFNLKIKVEDFILESSEEIKKWGKWDKNIVQKLKEMQKRY